MVKKINGNPVTGSGLLNCFQVSRSLYVYVLCHCFQPFLLYVKVYMKIYQSETLPEPKSMLEVKS